MGKASVTNGAVTPRVAYAQQFQSSYYHKAGSARWADRANNLKPADKWIERFEEWLADSGFLKRQ